MKKTGIYLLFSYAIRIGKERGFNKGRFFFLKSLLFPTTMVNWVKFTDSFFKRTDLGTVPWDIIATPLRLCLSNHLSAKDRTETLKSHFEILEKTLKKKTIHQLISGKELNLATIAGKGYVYEFNLVYSMIWRREGMFTILMKNKSDNHSILATISFTLFKNSQGENCLLIGGLQGAFAKSESGKEMVVKSTRDLHGLRPKYAVLNCVYNVADTFSVTKIIAVSVNNHPVKLTNTRRMKGFYADYDTFWQEVGGTVDSDGNFLLPSVLPKRKLEDVPSKKKKDWLGRQSHLKTISEQIDESLSQVSLLTNS